MTGEEPPEQIDHKSGDATDNRWDNLRDGTEINHYNRRINSNNTSGHSCVFWHIRMKKWNARVTHKGKTLFLGHHNKKEDAIRAVHDFWDEHRDVITKRHGPSPGAKPTEENA